MEVQSQSSPPPSSLRKTSPDNQTQEGVFQGKVVKIIGQKDEYLIQSSVDRKDAQEILKQTGYEISFAPGEDRIDNFVLGRGAFGVFYIGKTCQKTHCVGCSQNRST